MKKESLALENSTFPSIELLTSFLISFDIVPGKIYGRRNSSRNTDPIVITMIFAIFLLQRNTPIFIMKIKLVVWGTPVFHSLYGYYQIYLKGTYNDHPYADISET